MSLNACPTGAPVVDFFDHNSPDYVTERYRWFERIRKELGPVAWCSRHGGYWLVIGYDEINEALRDWQTFSSQHLRDADGTASAVGGIRYEGMFMPSRATVAPMIEADPPEWTLPRKALTPLFTPAAVERWRSRIQDLVDACIDTRIETGSIDFAHDLSNIVPAAFSLELAGVSTRRYDMVARLYHVASHLASDDPMWVELGEDAATLHGMILEALQARKEHRANDVISTLLNGRDKGDPFSDEQIAALANFIIAAGIDTTGSVLASTFVTLTERPDLRRRLIDDPDLTVTAFEEFVRLNAPTQGLCRTVTRDTRLGGQTLRRGDRAMLCFAAACRDPNAFDNPGEIDLDRKPNLHPAFGAGNHRCLGSQFARLEFEITLNTVLRRIPDFEVRLEEVRSFDNIGVVSGYQQVPATFTPGDRIGVDPGIPGWAP